MSEQPQQSTTTETPAPMSVAYFDAQIEAQTAMLRDMVNRRDALNNDIQANGGAIQMLHFLRTEAAKQEAAVTQRPAPDAPPNDNGGANVPNPPTE